MAEEAQVFSKSWGNTDRFGVGLYSPRVAAKIARIRYQEFQAWAKANLLRPIKVRVGNRLESAYTYRDLLLIRLVLRLRERGFQPKKIRKMLETISEMSGGDPHAWLKAAIYVDPDLIVAVIPGQESRTPVTASRGTQKMAVVFFPELVKELEKELVPPERFPNIEINPEVLGGSPVIKGTRIPTKAIAEIMHSGQDPHELYPSITEEQAIEAKAYEEFLEAA